MDNLKKLKLEEQEPSMEKMIANEVPATDSHTSENSEASEASNATAPSQSPKKLELSDPVSYTPKRADTSLPTQESKAPKKRGRRKKVVAQEQKVEKNPNLVTEEELVDPTSEDWDISKKPNTTTAPSIDVDEVSNNSKPDLWEEDSLEATVSNEAESITRENLLEEPQTDSLKLDREAKEKSKEKPKKSARRRISKENPAQSSQTPIMSPKPDTKIMDKVTPKAKSKSKRVSKSKKTQKFQKGQEPNKPSDKIRVPLMHSLRKDPPIESLNKDSTGDANLQHDKSQSSIGQPPVKEKRLSDAQIKMAKKIGVVLGVLLAIVAAGALISKNLIVIKESIQSFIPSWEEEKPLILGDDPPIPMETPKQKSTQGGEQGQSVGPDTNVLWAKSNQGENPLRSDVTVDEHKSTSKIKILPQNRGASTSTKSGIGQTKLPTRENQFCVIDAEIDNVIPSTLNPKKRYFSIVHPDDPSKKLTLETSTQALVALLDNNSIKKADKAKITLGTVNPRITAKYKNELKKVTEALGSKDGKSYSVEEYQIISKE